MSFSAIHQIQAQNGMTSCFPGNQVWQLASLRIHAESESGRCDASFHEFLSS